MFQDVYPQRGVERKRRLAVPVRPALVISSPEPPQPVYRSRQTVITDVVVGPMYSPQAAAVVETVTTEVSIQPSRAIISDVAAPGMFSPVPSVIAYIANLSAASTEGVASVGKSAKSDVVHPVIKKARRQVSRSRRKRRINAGVGRLLTIAKWLLIVGVVGLAIYVSVDGYLTNQELKRRLEALPAVGTSADATPEQRQQAEGTDETEPTQAVVKQYTVAADMPRYIKIGKIGIKGRVLQMGVNPDGSMQAPLNIYDAGWYNGSSKPGTDGAAVIDAHASGPSRQGLFAYLNKLQVGDEIEVEMGDGSSHKYRVVHHEVMPRDKVDMRKLMTVYGSAKQGLNLITCDGEWVRDGATFSDRAMVYTEKI